MTIEDLPPELRARYVGKTGKYRLCVFPSEDVWELEPLARFVEDLTAVDPDALGAPVMNFEYLRATKAGYEKAGLYAFLGVGFLALLSFRAVGPTLLALIPLTVGAVWTVGHMTLLRVPFNMANLLFLPLIAGIGSLMLSSHRGIHSLGLLVTLGVGSVLVVSVTALPSLLAILSSHGQETTDLSRESTADENRQKRQEPQRLVGAVGTAPRQEAR